MDPIDEAIMEGLLESRIYATESKRFLADGFHPPCWTKRKFSETWRVLQLSHRSFELYAVRHVHNGWVMVTNPNNKLNCFFVSAYCEQYLKYELQKI